MSSSNLVADMTEFFRSAHEHGRIIKTYFGAVRARELHSPSRFPAARARRPSGGRR